MTEVVSVKFKNRGKLYYFSPDDLQISDGTAVVVETSKGLELGECRHGNHWVTDEKIVPPLRSVIRIATEDDLRVARLAREREKEAFGICQKKIAAHGLDMKLVDVECSFDGSKIIFFFASEGRVDFRDLVKDLAGVFRTRIELRQIGVRDEAKMLGGLGICGRPFCCSQFLDDFAPVSTKMAKTQSMSLNPSKISGSCGRLMCCLRYEQEAYEELVKNVPKNGAFVQTPQGYGNITQINLLRQKIKVKLDGADQSIKTFEVGEVAAVPGGRPKPGAPLPDVLKISAASEDGEAETETTVPSEPEPNDEPIVEAAPSETVPEVKVPAAPEASADGESRERQPRPRRRSRKPRQPQDAQKPQVDKAAAPQVDKKPRQNPPKKPRDESAAQPQQGEGQRKSDGRRRYYRRKPKNGGGAPKSE